MHEDGLDARITRLETRTRRAMGGLGVCLAGVALLTGWTVSLRSELGRTQAELSDARADAARGLGHARELAVVDANGAVRARLGIDAEDATFLELRGPGEASGLRLVAASTGGALQITDARTQRAALGWLAEETGADRSTLRLSDRAGKPRAELVASDAVPALNLYNEQGLQTAGVP